MNKQKVLSIILVCCTLFLFYNSCRKDASIDINNPIDKKGWTLTFDDEFVDTVLNRTYWATNAGNNGQRECYTNENVSVKDGKLYLTVTPGQMQCWCDWSYFKTTNYKSGMVSSRESFNQKYGYWETKIKNPKGQGLWPALWMCAKESWPPEIDIFDNAGNEPGKTYMGTIIKENNKEKKTRQHRYMQDLTKDFHVYAIDWSAHSVKWYIDNNLIYETYRAIPHQPMFLLITMQIGGGFPGEPDATTPFPSSMIVDYVRVYKRNK